MMSYGNLRVSNKLFRLYVGYWCGFNKVYENEWFSRWNRHYKIVYAVKYNGRVIDHVATIDIYRTAYYNCATLWEKIKFFLHPNKAKYAQRKINAA